MKKIIRSISGIIIAIALTTTFVSTTSYAYSDVPWYFDFGETVVSINAGESKVIENNRFYFDYTYHIGPHTSTGTYVECTYKRGTENIVIHIGADETVKNVFFYFYVDDEELGTCEFFDNIEVYVQNIKQTSESVAAPIAGGKSGTLTKDNNRAMLYNQNGVAMASFALGRGGNNYASFSILGVVNNGSNYFNVVAGQSNVTPVISESDKAVMIANGYAGVCVNGKYINWP